jgi:hypothetical protein
MNRKGRRRELRVVAKYGEPMTDDELQTWLKRYTELVIDSYKEGAAAAPGQEGAEGWEAPEEGLEPPTQSLTQPGAPTADRVTEAKPGAESPLAEQPRREKSAPKPSPKPSPPKRRL